MAVCGQLNPVRDPLGTSCMKSYAVANVRSPRRNDKINFVSASSAVHVQQSPQLSAFLSAVVFFSFEPTNDQISSHCTRFAERLRNFSS
jgi:hypothetical protein